MSPAIFSRRLGPGVGVGEDEGRGGELDGAIDGDAEAMTEGELGEGEGLTVVEPQAARNSPTPPSTAPRNRSRREIAWSLTAESCHVSLRDLGRRT
jgi:hypothetical protein